MLEYGYKISTTRSNHHVVEEKAGIYDRQGRGNQIYKIAKK